MYNVIIIHWFYFLLFKTFLSKYTHSKIIVFFFFFTFNYFSFINQCGKAWSGQEKLMIFTYIKILMFFLTDHIIIMLYPTDITKSIKTLCFTNAKFNFSCMLYRGWSALDLFSLGRGGGEGRGLKQFFDSVEFCGLAGKTSPPPPGTIEIPPRGKSEFNTNLSSLLFIFCKLSSSKFHI